MKLSYYFSAIILIVLFQGCSGGSGGAFPGPGGQQQEATSVETIIAETTDVSDQIKSFGNIRAQEIVNVMPQISNRITQVYAQLGDTVRQGEVLAKIYEVPYRDQFQQAKLQIEQSHSAYVRDSLQFQRQKKLYKKNLISSTTFEEARAAFLNSKAQYQASRASLTQSREDLDNTEIRSPVYGVVLSRNIAVGDLASTGEAAYQIANLTGLQARVFLPLEEWEKVEVGQPVDFRVSNREGISGKGRVTHISPRLDPTTGLGEVIISITDRGPYMHQGVLVESTINVTTHQNVVTLPRAALVENVQTLIEPESNSIQLERSYSAFIVQGDSLAIRHKLKLGIEQGNKVEILEGIQPGDEVVITGQSSLDDSTRVQVASNELEALESPEIPIKSSDQPADSAAVDTSGKATQ